MQKQNPFETLETKKPWTESEQNGEKQWEENKKEEGEPEDNVNIEDPIEMFKSPSGDGQLFVLVGKSERGKTHFLRWVLSNMMNATENRLEFGIVFVKTKFTNSFQFLPKSRTMIVQGFNEHALKQFVLNLEKMYKKLGKARMPSNFVVFDDLVGVINNGSEWFTNWIATFRHLKTNIFTAVQYLTGRKAISPIMREQTTAAIMFNSRTHITLENLYKAYGGLFPNLQLFKQYFLRHTDKNNVGPYMAMVYFERLDALEDNYLMIRAPKDIPEVQELESKILY